MFTDRRCSGFIKLEKMKEGGSTKPSIFSSKINPLSTRFLDLYILIKTIIFWFLTFVLYLV